MGRGEGGRKWRLFRRKGETDAEGGGGERPAGNPEYGDTVEFDGQARSPNVVDEQLRTGRYATKLSFFMERPGQDPKSGTQGNLSQLEVVIRGAPRIQGTVFRDDRVRGTGEVGERNIVVVESVEEVATGATVRPVERVPARRRSEERFVLEGQVIDAVPSLEIDRPLYEGSEMHQYAVLNIKVLPKGNTGGEGNYRNVEVVGAPMISGNVGSRHEVRVFGEEDSGVVRAARVENANTGVTVQPVQKHDPRSGPRKVLDTTFGIVLIAGFAIFFVAVVVLWVSGLMQFGG